MCDDKIHSRHIMLYQFRKGNNAVKATKKFCDVYGGDAVNVRTVQKWFKRFRDGNFSLKDEKHSGRPTEVDDD